MCGRWGNGFLLHKGTFLLFCLPSLFFFLLFTSFLPWMTENDSEKGWISSASMLVSPQLITCPNYYPSFCCATNMPFPLTPSQHRWSPKSKQYCRETICSVTPMLTPSKSFRFSVGIQIWHLCNWDQNLVLSVEECIPDCFYWKNLFF